MSNVKEFPERFRRMRKAYNYKLYEVADMLHVSIPTVSSYERGTRMPTFSGLVEICKIFNCSADYLLGLDGGKPDSAELAVKLKVLRKQLDELEEILAKLQTSNQA